MTIKAQKIAIKKNDDSSAIQRSLNADPESLVEICKNISTNLGKQTGRQLSKSGLYHSSPSP